MVTINDIRKYLDYVFNRRSFRPDSSWMLRGAAIPPCPRGSTTASSNPALMIHGLMPRSGTVYVGQLLRLHPDLHAFPREVWELPTLQLSPEILQLQREFFRIYEQNVDKMSDTAFLEIVGRGMLSYLQYATPPGKRMLLKVPSVQYLYYFPTMYPGQHMLLLVRDGRDVVESTIKTWPQILFRFACRRWKRAAEMVTSYHEHQRDQPTGYWLGRFEDAVLDPEGFMREACQRFELDVGRYPFDQIDSIRIHGSSRIKPGGKVTWDPQTRPADFLPMGYWHDWSPRRRRTFKAIAGEALRKLRYCEDLQW